MILLVDNYDSFVHNLARYLRRLGQSVHVARNDEIDVPAVRELRPQALVLSPGPCAPAQAGVCLELVRVFTKSLPIFGVCLGHQVIAEALGGKIIRSPEPRHGRASEIHHDGSGLFAGLPSPFLAGRYHSLLVDAATLPVELQITARTATGLPMALAHRQAPVFGVQFHPESILTEHGYELLAAFLRAAKLPVSAQLPTAQSENRAPLPLDRALPTRPVTF